MTLLGARSAPGQERTYPRSAPHPAEPQCSTRTTTSPRLWVTVTTVAFVVRFVAQIDLGLTDPQATQHDPIQPIRQRCVPNEQTVIERVRLQPQHAVEHERYRASCPRLWVAGDRVFDWLAGGAASVARKYFRQIGMFELRSPPRSSR